jgi:hypothetical protein
MHRTKTERQERFSLAALTISIVISDVAFFAFIAPTV